MPSFQDIPKDSTGRDYATWPAAAFSGQTFVRYCFSQESPDMAVFPPAMVGATFVNCNLDNCAVPEGNAVEGGTRRRFRAQPDGLDWLLDDHDQPLSILG